MSNETNVNTRVEYKFLDVVEKLEACNYNETRVQYKFLEYSEGEE